MWTGDRKQWNDIGNVLEGYLAAFNVELVVVVRRLRGDPQISDIRNLGVTA